jgi:PAS domain S-box-containing protein
MLDPAGNVTVWNAGAERVLEYTEKEAVGQNGRFIFTPEDRAKGESEKELQTARDKGYAMDERWHLRKSGERFWGSGVVTAVYHADGSLRGFVKVMRDNTDRKVSEQSLEAARRAAVAASEAKDQFLAVVSHELRTPLSVILLWTKMIRTSGLGKDELAEGMAAIESSAEAQKQLIEDLLDTTRISSGKLRLNMRETDLVEVTRAATNTIRPTADARGVKLKEDYGKDVGMVQADPDRLQQVIWNLLSNAVKFTPANGRVDVGLWRREDSIEIRIADTGRGMAPEFLPHLFERFKQAESVHTRAHGGLGLGLAIAKQLVELHGGTIEAHSEGIDKGSTFTVHLPLPRLRRGKSKSARGHAHLTVSHHPLTDKHILLVEDNEETAKAVGLLLRTAGAKVTSVLSAAAALKEFSNSRPDLILSDIAMPDMDGYALIQKIRATELEQNISPIPAVSLSAFARDEDRIKAIQSGFNDHVAKPVDTQQLITTLTRALNRA